MAGVDIGMCLRAAGLVVCVSVPVSVSMPSRFHLGERGGEGQLHADRGVSDHGRYQLRLPRDECLGIVASSEYRFEVLLYMLSFCTCVRERERDGQE